MADKTDILESFKAVTGASNGEAQFFLEANAWDLDVATSAFLDSEDMSVHQAPPQPPQPTVHYAPPQPTAAPKKKSSGPARGGVATLRDFGNKDDSDSEDDDVQKYYAGGEKSGQMIHYPKDKDGKKDGKDVVGEVFNSAKRQGATAVEENKPAAPSYFSGTGFKLGDNVTQSTAIKPAAKPAAGNRQEVRHTVTFWRNGFVVDNGPFRTMTDPASQQFVQDITRGVVPTELEQGGPPGTDYSIDLVDNRNQDYKEPSSQPKVQAFSGSGQTLGSTASAPPPVTTQPDSKPRAFLQVDESQPTTSIQLRLGDGTRLVAKFNHTHTVGDIRRFVDAARRGTQSYNLMTTFPQKVLTDNSVTIAAAGLQNAVIVQQML